MIVNALSFLGSVIGYFIGKFTKEELKPGKFYFMLLEAAVLAALIVFLSMKDFNLILFVIGVIFGFILRFEYFYFGIILAQNINFLNAGLIFLYGLPYGTLVFYKKNFKILFYSAVLFAAGSLAVFLDYNLASFAAGGIASILVLTIKNLSLDL